MARGQQNLGFLKLRREYGVPGWPLSMKLRLPDPVVSRENTVLSVVSPMSLWDCHDDAGARFRASPVIAVLHRRIEVDRVFSLKQEFVAANLDGQGSLQQIQQLHTGMLMRPLFLIHELLKFRDIPAQLPFVRFVIEALEEVGNVLCPGTLRKAHPILLAHDADHAPLAFVGEEVIQPDGIHHRNPQQRRQSREELAPFEFRKQCRRKPGMLAEFDQPHVLLEPQGPQLLPDRVALQTRGNRIRRIRHNFVILKEIFPTVNMTGVGQQGGRTPRSLAMVGNIRSSGRTNGSAATQDKSRSLTPALFRRLLLLAKQPDHIVDRVVLLLLPIAFSLI